MTVWKPAQWQWALGAKCHAAGRPVTLVESVTFTALPSAKVNLSSEKLQSLASAMEPALAAWMSMWSNLKSVSGASL